MAKVAVQDVEAVVFSALDRLREVLPATIQIDRKRETLLLADGTSLDSMAIVNLLVFIEEEMARALGRVITLAGVNGDDGVRPEELASVGTIIDAIFARLI